MCVIIKKLNKVFYIAVFLLFPTLVYSQTTPVTGTALIDLGGTTSGTTGTQITVPVNINLTNVTATDTNGGTVDAVLGHYRIAVSYNNTQLKAKITNGFVSGGSTAEFSNAVTANIITNGDNDLILLSASQINNSAPLGQANVAQIPFDLVGSQAATATLSVTVLDLRTPVIVTGQVDPSIIGGVALPFQVFETQINIQAPLDADNDGLPDDWEQLYPGFIVGVDESAFDNDLDGLSNLEEYANNTSPINPDSDGDLVPDGYEVANNNDPADLNDFPLWIISEPVTTGVALSQYSYQIVANKPAVTYSLVLPPSGMVVEPNSGLITWNPDENQSGMHDITVNASGDNETVEQIYTIVVAGTGDVNGDGSINVADYLLLQQHVLGAKVLTPEQQSRADLYVGEGDGLINIQDLILLNKKVLGL